MEDIKASNSLVCDLFFVNVRLRVIYIFKKFLKMSSMLTGVKGKTHSPNRHHHIRDTHIFFCIQTNFQSCLYPVDYLLHSDYLRRSVDGEGCVETSITGASRTAFRKINEIKMQSRFTETGTDSKQFEMKWRRTSLTKTNRFGKLDSFNQLSPCLFQKAFFTHSKTFCRTKALKPIESARSRWME